MWFCDTSMYSVATTYTADYVTVCLCFTLICPQEAFIRKKTP